MTLEHLCDAAATGDDTAVKEIIAQGDVDVNGAWNPDEDDYEWGNFHSEWHQHNGTPLHYSMTFNHPTIVSILLASNLTKLNMLDGDGWTPLHWASHKDNVECVKLFLRDTRCNLDIVNTKSKAGIIESTKKDIFCFVYYTKSV
jgi:ankyrin repeat protein